MKWPEVVYSLGTGALAIIAFWVGARATRRK